jgi:hypothetical protein
VKWAVVVVATSCQLSKVAASVGWVTPVELHSELTHADKYRATLHI